MTNPWTFAGESVSLGEPGASVTLVEGSAFSISSRSGDMRASRPEGLFYRDTRFLSGLHLTINGVAPEPLAATLTDPFSAVFVSRTAPRTGQSGGPLLVFRYRWIGRGMREDIVVRNFGDEPAYCAVEIDLDADFADVFEVKEGRASPPAERSCVARDGALWFEFRRGGVRRGAHVVFGEGAVLDDSVARYEVLVPAREEWSTCFQVAPVIEGEEVEPRYRCGQPVEQATPVERLRRWRREIPIVDTDHDALRTAVTRGADDLGALRLFDPEYPERTIVAAGAPWFMSPFGRDSLITSWMALLVDPDLALGVLQTLARFQGEQVDARTDEEPGRILHEMRFGKTSTLALGGAHIYYGTADATPLFVMLLGELRRWGLAPEAVDQLLPHADRAMQWIEDFGDRDGDGYVEYQRGADRGLQNQGWKDSWDGVRFANGDVARTPIALAEVQAYVYSAYLARHYFAVEAGDGATALRYREKAAALKEAFNRDFWLADRGWFAMALDGRKQPVDALASNMGHCLWAGIVDEDKAARVADLLLAPEMFSGWGIRTMSTTMTGYNPLSYHCGSVWPHDNAIAAAGLMRYGFVEAAHRVIGAMLDVAHAGGGRLPELFSGLARSEFPTVVSYPTSCSPQAWASASPLLFLRTLLRLDPWVPHGKVWLDPALPDDFGPLCVKNVPLAGARVDIEIDGRSVRVGGLPPGLELVRGARHPLTAV